MGSCQLKVFLAGRVAARDRRCGDRRGALPGAAGPAPVRLPGGRAGKSRCRGTSSPRRSGAEAPPATWDKALTVIVSKLRNLLADHGIDGANALTGAFGCYRLELPEGTWVDVDRGGERGAGGGGSARGRRPGRGEDRGRAGRIARSAALPARRGGDVGRGEAARTRRRPWPRAERAGRCVPAFR